MIRIVIVEDKKAIREGLAVLLGMSGIEATHQVKEIRSASEILILTVREDDGSIFKALCAGACGYLVKDTPPAELVGAITEAHQGGSPMSSRIARRVVTLFKDKFEPPRKSDIRITEREHEVLSNLAQGNSYSAIADTMCVAADTVRFHIRNIYRKLHVHSQTAAVAKAIREDLI